MTLPSGADVRIGGVDYVLEPSVNHYQHRFESLFANATAIAGEIAKSQLRPEKLLWAHTDWSGGEGARIYYPNDPTRYDVSTGLNVTQRGLVTSRTRRYRSAVARSGSTANTSHRPAVGTAYDKSIIAWSDNHIYSRNAVGWTAATNGTSTGSYSYFDMDTDGRFALPGVIREGSTANIIPAFDGSSATAGDADVATETTTHVPPEINEVLDGVWYTWALDGSSSVITLYKGAGLSTTSGSSSIYTASMVPVGLFASDYYLDLETAENGLFASIGSSGGSYVYEIRADVGRPFWTSPPGFVIKKLVYHLGVLFCVGAQHAGGKKFGALFAIPLSSRNPVFLGSPRRHQNEEVHEFTAACPGHGASIFLADAHSGKIFIYDMDTESLSLFDDLANNGTDDGTSFTAWTNLLPLATATMEASTAALNGWTAGSSCTLGVTTTSSQFRSGRQGLTITRNGTTGVGSAITATGLNGFVVQPDTQYTAFAYYRPVASNRTTSTIITWYDDTGASISTSTSAGVSSVTTQWTQDSVTATSPSTAAYASITVSLTTMAASEVHCVDGVSLHPGSSVADQDQIAGIAMHGSRLVVPTWQPSGVGTSLQVITYEDTQRENRDDSQSVSASITSSEWDYGLPQELKALIGFYVTYEVTDDQTTSGLVEDSRITVSYATDGGDFVNLTTITSSTAVAAQGRHFLEVSNGASTVSFSRLRVKLTLDNNGEAVAPPIVFSVVAEAQLMAYAETWDLVVQVRDEDNEGRPRSRQRKSHILRDNLIELATNKSLVTFLDGARIGNNIASHLGYTTHTVVVEDPTDVIQADAQGFMSVRLRAVPT